MFCEDFDDLVNGQLPAELRFTKATGSGSYRILSGGLQDAGSIELVAGNYPNPAWLDVLPTQDLESGYIRFRTKLIQGSPGVSFFVLLENGTSNMDGKSIRLRIFDNYTLAWNVGDGDPLAPDVTDPGQKDKSVRLPLGQTACMEIFYDNTNNLIRFWMNDTNIPGMTIDNDPNTDFDQRWLRSHNGFYDVNISLIRLGWQGNSSGTTQFDNIVVSPTRIGCN